MSENWQCPYCNHHSVVSKQSRDMRIWATQGNNLSWMKGDYYLIANAIVCSNNDL